MKDKYFGPKIEENQYFINYEKVTLPIRFGLVTGAVLMAYFLILALVHKHTKPVFSFLNAAITAFGVYEAVRLKKIENISLFS